MPVRLPVVIALRELTAQKELAHVLHVNLENILKQVPRSVLIVLQELIVALALVSAQHVQKENFHQRLQQQAVQLVLLVHIITHLV